MSQSSRFRKLADDAKSRVREIPASQAMDRQKEGAILIDVREAEEFAKGHVTGAIHLSRGIIELKIEEVAPDTATPIVCYCGGGSRSTLVAESLQRMGYTNVFSMTGGYKSWKDEGLATS